MTRPKLLDLFSGEGGAAAGYARAGFDVLGVDTVAARLDRYPFHSVRFDAICTGYSRGTAAIPNRLGTPLWMRRHRLFESNVPLWAAGGCQHPRDMQCAGAYGGARRDKWEAKHVRKGGYVPSVEVMRDLLGTPWMSEKGCQLSIPPAYTEHIGAQLIEHLRWEAA